MLQFYCPNSSIAQTLLAYARATDEPLEQVTSPHADQTLLVIDTEPKRLDALCEENANHQWVIAGPSSTSHIRLPMRIEALIHEAKRLSKTAPALMIEGTDGWQLNTDTLEHKARNTSVALTDKEAALLRYLLTHAAQKTVSRETLLAHVWHYDADAQTNTLETHIHRLRTKLSQLDLPEGCGIITKENGYVWVNSSH